MKQFYNKLTLNTLLLLSAVFTFAQPATYPSMLTVAKDGTADFKTIQEAVNAVRDLSQMQVTIYVKNGTYNEKLVIPSWKKKILLLGQSKDSTIITNDDYSGKIYYGGKDIFGKDKFSTYTSYTVLIQGDDCSIENLTIKNTAGRVGQAVALHVEGDRFVARNCSITGNQDTLYTATNDSRQYYRDCYIEGTTDFIFGEATVVFQNCIIKSLSNSYITAASTTPQQQYGFVFFDCKLIADPAATKVFLWRPWRPHAKTVFINTEMGGHIHPVAWDNWRNHENEKTVLYAEYNSRGEGAKIKERAKWSKQLSRKQVKKYTLASIFNCEASWVPEG